MCKVRYIKDPSGRVLARSNPGLYAVLTQSWPGLTHAVRYFAGQLDGDMHATGNHHGFQITIASVPSLAVAVGSVGPAFIQHAALVLKLPNNDLEHGYWKSHHPSIAQRSRLKHYLAAEALALLASKSADKRDAALTICRGLGLLSV